MTTRLAARTARIGRERRCRLPSWRTLLIPLLGALATVAACASSAYAESIPPVGIGDLIPAPKRPSGPGTLFETYPGSLYILDVQLGWDEFGDQMGTVVPDICMALTVTIGSATVSVICWIFQVTTLPQLGPGIESAISGAAGILLPTLLPVGLAAGGLVAVSRRAQAGGSELGQLGWVAAASLAAVSLLTSPHVWVQGIDDTRTFGADVAMASASAGIPDAPRTPIDVGAPAYTGDPRADMPRKAGDAVWRAYVVTPWCIAEFGSIRACEKYGKGLLDQGIDRETRETWLAKNVTDNDVGKDAVKWRQGHTPQGRLAVTLMSLVAVVLFGLLTIVLAFASLASLIGALMLLVAGSVFACCWMVPGRPRQWGVRWFDALFGLVIQSFVVTMVLGCVLTINTAAVSMMPQYGWLPSIGISICAIVMALKFRKILETILGIGGSSSGMVGGYLLSRAVSSVAGGRSGRSGARGVGHGRSRGGLQPDGGNGPDRPDGSGPSRPSPIRGSGGFGGWRAGRGLFRPASATPAAAGGGVGGLPPPRSSAPRPTSTEESAAFGAARAGATGSSAGPGAATGAGFGARAREGGAGLGGVGASSGDVRRGGPSSGVPPRTGPSPRVVAGTVVGRGTAHPVPRASAVLRPERGAVPVPAGFRVVPAAGSVARTTRPALPAARPAARPSLATPAARPRRRGGTP